MKTWPKYAVLRCERENSWTIGRLCTEASHDWPTYLGMADAANPEAAARIVRALIATDQAREGEVENPPARPISLEWGPNERPLGTDRPEWHAPCGCAWHPDPTPHIHFCSRNHQEQGHRTPIEDPAA